MSEWCEIIFDNGKTIGKKQVSTKKNEELNRVLEQARREGSSERVVVFDNQLREVPPASPEDSGS